MVNNNNKVKPNTMLEDMENVTKGQDSSKPKEELGSNKQFFNKTIQEHLSEDRIRQEIGDLNTKWKEDSVETILTEADKKKLDEYDKLEAKDLPSDWKKQLKRKEWLEIKLGESEQTQKDLNDWKNPFSPHTISEVLEIFENLKKDKVELEKWKKLFSEQQPYEVDESKKNLSEKLESISKELEKWKEEFLGQSPKDVKTKVELLESKLKELTNFWGDSDLQKIKDELELLRKRPNIPITDKEFYDDYARRWNLTKSKEREKEFEAKRAEVEKQTKENKQLWNTIDKFLEMGRIRRYILAERVSTISQAREAIARLLDQTEKDWKLYLESKKDEKENVTVMLNKKIDLGFSFDDKEKRDRAYQILAWITEAKSKATTDAYQELFERWNGEKEYSKKYDFDGSLYLLKKYLEVKNIEVPKINDPYIS